MAHYTAFLVSLVALFGFGHVYGLPMSHRFDYLMLSLEWPPSFCQGVRCNIPPWKLNGWNVHGLWPGRFHGKYGPQSCNGAPYVSEKLDPIRGILQVNWVNLYDYSSCDRLWDHEWTKHGTCCSSDSLIDTELKYFNTTVQLKFAIDLFSALSKHGITPTLNQTYQISDIEGVLRSIYGVTVNIRCIEFDGDLYWLETRLCFDPTLALINCPLQSIYRSRKLRNLMTIECSEEVKYLNFDQERQKLAMRWKRLQRSSLGFDHL